MKYMGLNELRTKFLQFFEERGHYILPSFSLVPKDDKSLLLINSGMAPLKPYFSGEKTPPSKRVATCQKCIRVKDIENVGKTARHGTFFEMLGNFSFGDYFKEEALTWSWEFLTKVLEMDEELLYPSVYIDDDEAYDIWTKKIGVPKSKVTRLGKSDNFWEHGSGPCGPCSEIYFDRGKDKGCQSPYCKPGCDCDRFIEIWNNVFTQFNNDGNGNYTTLKQKNIDTGMGLERLAIAVQGVDNLVSIDTIKRILERACKILNVEYGKNEKADNSICIITDHIRSTVFLVCDGVMPSNEQRGYVLRRLLRRAARHGRLLGYEKPFLYELCDTVIEENKEAYPELKEKAEYIKKVIKIEEENFDKTIDQGLNVFNEMTDGKRMLSQKMLSGEDAFKLYDTFGFPIDLTLEIAEERGISVDTEGFGVCMDEQRERARSSRKQGDSEAWGSSKTGHDIKVKTEFVGYSKDTVGAKIIAVLSDGEEVKIINKDQKAAIITDVTPFYAESGGQVGDKGTIESENGVFVVTDTQKSAGVYMHYGYVSNGFISFEDAVCLTVDRKKRLKTGRNHSCVHLLQTALKKVLGDHVQQAGSYVDDSRLRFDFTHFSQLTTDELEQVEMLVNESIQEALEITCKEMPIEEARKLGAIALFDEKYGDVVRVVTMGDKSIELCGGVHTDNTAKIGVFKIVYESSVASGVRRIEGVCGIEVLKMLKESEKLIEDTAKALKTQKADIVKKAESVLEQTKKQQKEIESLSAKIAGMQSEKYTSLAKEKSGIKVLCAITQASAEEVKVLTESCAEKLGNSVVCFIGTADEKAQIYCVCSKAAVEKGANASNIVKEAIKCLNTQGGGGGKADVARGACVKEGIDKNADKKLTDVVLGIIK